jgi:hypothetical protein
MIISFLLYQNDIAPSFIYMEKLKFPEFNMQTERERGREYMHALLPGHNFHILR